MRYLVIIEKSETGFGAYSPDLEGCVATGTTIDDAEATMRGAIEFHIETLKADGLDVPQPNAYVTYIEVAA
ncbi:MAG: type II toxin-antitoxin system HicB family antitoxin [Acidobacteria bacterium]|nr:type II toxin-antitoxin system HicB family antitoxin [Acidobacteriota bacterium]